MINHHWQNGKCVFCGASIGQYKRGDDLETHAYEWIHMVKPEEIFKMKFDVIISNPPYQLETGGSGRQAKPIYNKFVEQSMKLNPRFLTMIIPARWFAGGMGLDSFRDKMLKDGRIRYLTDYPNAKECFSGVSISGGVCYFLWDRDNKGNCQFTNIVNGQTTTLERPLNEFPVLVRYNLAITILHKVLSHKEVVFGVEPPMFVNLEVTETEPGIRGNTATNVTKPATVETGAEIRIPLFVDQGDVIRIDTRTGEYVDRA